MNKNTTTPLDFWFHDSMDGNSLYVILFTKKCQWSRCYACSLHETGSTATIASEQIIKQIDFVFENVIKDQRESLNKIILSNNGSIFDESTFSKVALDYFLKRVIDELPNLCVLSIESRIEYIKAHDVKTYSSLLLKNKIKLEFAVGIEVYDSQIRNRVYKKGLTNRSIEKFSSMLADYDCQLKAYFMYKPIPEMSEDAAIADIHNAIHYFDKISTKYALDVNLHLNITYISTGSELHQAFNDGTYEPPSLHSIAEAIRPAKDKRISVHIGYYNEGLADTDIESSEQEKDKLFGLFENFNKTQDYHLLELT